MKTKQRKRLERVMEQICTYDNYCPQGYIVGIDVNHSYQGRGRVIALKKDICTVQFSGSALQTEVPISHLLEGTHLWTLDYAELSSEMDAYEADFAFVKRKCKIICAMHQAIMEEILTFERGVIPEFLTSLTQMVWNHEKAMRNNKLDQYGSLVDHRFAIASPMRPSAPDKKSISSACWPILA